jgi:hypothetical protein
MERPTTSRPFFENDKLPRFGVRVKPSGISIINTIPHGIEAPNIVQADTLSKTASLKRVFTM